MTAKSKFNLEYINTDEQRTVSLEAEGFPCVQAIFRGQFRSTQPHLGFHRHPGCLEMSLCVRGSLTFECEGKVYRPMPGMIFVTQPRDLHHLTLKPKGMRHYGMLLRLPRAGETLLGLPADESAALVALIQEIRQFPEKRHCVEDLARRVGMSESVLTVAFKKLTGLSPYAFVANCRLQRAREEIETTRDSFATIAMRLGYASAQHLARQFKSAFGQTMSGCRAGLTPSQRR